MQSVLRILGFLILFTLLTIISQIGGIALIISIVLSRSVHWTNRYKATLLFIGIYLLCTFILVPPLAKMFGREPVSHSQKIQPTSWYTTLLNRNYVKPELNELLKRVEEKLKGSDVTIHYLDASFPFFNKFPLLPHLSHNDGRKLDLSLIYETSDGRITGKQKSNSGYGVFEEPQNNEYNQIKKCLDQGYFQYDYPKYLIMGRINRNLRFSEKGTKLLVESILADKSLGKLFIEPHLKERLHLKSQKISYHGCRAVRHDDHVHIQI